MSGDKNFPPSSSDSSKQILLNSAVYKGNPGDAAISALSSPVMLLFPSDENGQNVDYTQNEVSIYVYEGGVLVGSGNNPLGWTMAVIQENNCQVSVNNLVGEVINISADSASAVFRVSKSGYSSFEIEVPFAKVKQGATGDEGPKGDPGERGTAGPIGLQGASAGSYVIERFHVKVLRPDYVTVADNGSGNCRITYPNPHNIIVGEKTILYGPGNTTEFINSRAEVLDVIDPYTLDLDLAYDVNYNQANTKCPSMRHFIRNDNVGGGPYFSDDQIQYLDFSGAFPKGAKPDFISIARIDSSNGYAPSYITAGCVIGGNQYINSQLVNNFSDIRALEPIQVRLDDPSISFYLPHYIYDLSSDSRQNLHFYLDIAAQSWNVTFPAYEWEVFIAYKSFVATEGDEYPVDGQFTILDGANGTFDIGDTAEHSNIKMNITVERDNKKYSQVLDFVYDGAALHLSKGAINPYIASAPTLNLAFDKAIDGTTIQLTYNSTAGTGDAIIKYKIERL